MTWHNINLIKSLLFNWYHPSGLSLICPGWNVYQRKWFQKKSLSPAQWKERQQDCVKAWKKLTPKEREPFIAEAAVETGSRREGTKQLFPSSRDDSTIRGNVAWDAVKDLSRNAAKKISLHRIVATRTNFENDPAWADWNGGIASAEGCLHLDRIDLETRNEDIYARWKSAVQDPVPQALWMEKDAQTEHVHHQVCQALHGTCQSSPGIELAKKFVDAFHRFVVDGPSVLLDLL